jgi:hypothetical protein
MIKLITVAGFALALATSAQAMTPGPIPQPDRVITQVAFGCGPGRTELAVSAWQEPPSAMPAERPVDAHFGAAVFVVAGSSSASQAPGRAGRTAGGASARTSMSGCRGLTRRRSRRWVHAPP